MVYQGLNAHYDCGYFSSFTTGAVYDTTIAYPSDALSTYVGPLWMAAQTGPEPSSLFQAINYTEFQEYVANTANEGYSKNLKIPSDLAGIDPAWSTCTPGMYGSWDPPRALTAARNMVAPTSAQPDVLPSATAVPAAVIAPTHLPATPTSSPKDSGIPSLKPDPPIASADPGSESEDPQSKGNSDPGWSAGQADSTTKDSNTGGDPVPASKQGDPPDQQYSSQNTLPSTSSPGPVHNLPVAGPNSADKDEGASASGLNVVTQGPLISAVTSKGSVHSPLPLNSVVLASPSPLTVGDNTIEKAIDGGAVIGKSTYTAGYEGKLSNTPISVGVDNVVVGTITHSIPTSTPVLVGGSSMVKAGNGGVVIGSSTYSPGSHAQISDTSFSVGVDSVIVDGTPYAIPTPSSADSFLINNSPITRAPGGGAIFQGGTVGVGSQTTINSHVISVGSSTVVVDGTSYALPISAGTVLQSPHPQPNAPVTLTNGVILTPGGAGVTFSGTAYAIPSDDTGLVVNGQTVPFPTQTTFQSVFTVAGQAFTATPTGFAIGSQSVALDGTAATFNGTVVSLGPSGLQIGSKTMPLTSAQATEGNLGGLIMSGFGSGVEPGVTAGGGNGSSGLAFTGAGNRVGTRLGIILSAIVIQLVTLLL